MRERGGGSITIFRRNLLGLSIEKFRWASLPGFKKICHRKFPCMRMGTLSRSSDSIFKLKMLVKAKIRTHSCRFRTLLSYPLCNRKTWNFWQMSLKLKKYLARQRLETRTTALETFSCHTADICFRIKNRGKFGLPKENQLYGITKFSCISQMRRKITNDNICSNFQLYGPSRRWWIEKWKFV